MGEMCIWRLTGGGCAWGERCWWDWHLNTNICWHTHLPLNVKQDNEVEEWKKGWRTIVCCDILFISPQFFFQTVPNFWRDTLSFSLFVYISHSVYKFPPSHHGIHPHTPLRTAPQILAHPLLSDRQIKPMWVIESRAVCVRVYEG